MIEEAIIAVLGSVLLGELVKVIVQWAGREPIRPFELGGMPSTHSAAVSALFFAVYFETGLSLLLLVCAVFGYIVLRDAYGARWEVSRHSVALNKLLKTTEFLRVGHRELEVTVGFILGAVVTVLVYILL